MEQHDVKLRIVLDGRSAADALEKRDAPQRDPGAGDGAPRDREDRSQERPDGSTPSESPSGRRRREAPSTSYGRPSEDTSPESIGSAAAAAVVDTAQAFRRGDASRQILDLTSSMVPGGGLAVGALGFADQYGLAALSAAASLMPDAVKPFLSPAEAALRKYGQVRAQLDAFGVAFDRTAAVAGGGALIGSPVAAADLVRFGANTRSIAAEIASAQNAQRLRDLEALGSAGGQLVADALHDVLGYGHGR